MLPILLSLFLSLTQTLSHSHIPETEHEIEVQRALRAAAYHVSLIKTAFWLDSDNLMSVSV